MNLAHLLDDHPADRVALTARGQPVTYGRLRELVDGLRGGLAGLGIGPGDRVGLVCGNGTTFVVAYLAVLGRGAVVVPLNPASPGPELARELTAAKACAVVVEPMAATAFSSIPRDSIGRVAHVLTPDGQGVPGARSVEELSRAEPVTVVEVEPDHLAVLAFTSGTAGMPKAAMLTHGNLRSNIDQTLTTPAHVGADDVVFGVLPLHHIFGLNVVLGTALTVGACVVLAQRFDPATALDTIVERGVTVVPGAPPMWVAWSQFDQAPPAAFAGVRLALSGAAKLPEEAAVRLRDRFGLEVAEGYGLTEAAPVVTSSAGLAFRPGSIGRVVDGVEVRLVDPATGEDALDGDAGEIWVRGPNVFHGYLDDPEATARAITPEGWLRTGDIAMSDDDGYLYLLDRAKDLVIVSGFNVYPGEVEAALREHPGVAEAAVVGVPHPHTGEAVKAYVVPSGRVPIDEDALIGHCTDRLARYKAPTKILIVTELPKGYGGKVLRRNLV